MVTINSWGSSTPAEVAKGGTGQETLLIHGLLAGNTTGAITSLAVMTNGQLLVGSTTADPAPHTITSSDSTIAFTIGAGTISFQARAGTESVTGVVQFGTAAQTTTGTSEALSVHPAGLNTKIGTQTQYGVMLGGGGAGFNLGVTDSGDTGQIFRSKGAAANPDYTTFTMPETFAQGDLLFASAANVVGGLTKDASATRYICNSGADNAPVWAQITLTNGVTGVLPTANGGTGIASPTEHTLIIGGAGAAAMTNLGVAVDGQLLIGSSAADPVLSTLTAGAGIGILNAGGAITLSVTGSGMAWSEITSSASAAVANGYICNHADTEIVLTLPATFALGSIIQIVGKGAAAWSLEQNALQQVFIGTSSTTIGVGGSLTSTAVGDCIEIVCTEADVGFRVNAMIGNINIV